MQDTIATINVTIVCYKTIVQTIVCYNNVVAIWLATAYSCMDRARIGLINRPWPIMLKILPIMLLSNAQKIAHYAHEYY